MYLLMLPDCSREYLLKKISWGSIPPNPPSKFTAAPFDRQISVFIAKTQSHACSSHQNINYSTDCNRKFVKSIINNDIYIQVLSAFPDYSLLFRRYLQRNN